MLLVQDSPLFAKTKMPVAIKDTRIILALIIIPVVLWNVCRGSHRSRVRDRDIWRALPGDSIIATANWVINTNHGLVPKTLPKRKMVVYFGQGRIVFEMFIFVKMERLIINIPEANSAEIKTFLKSMGVTMDGPKLLDMDAYRSKITGIGHWSEDDIKVLEENRKALVSFKPQGW